jgi:hypothetical protein
MTRHEAGVVLLLALAAAGSAWAVRRRRLRPGWAAAFVAVLAVADLARAGAGLNPQVQASFFDPLPEMAALRLDTLDGGRVFSYGLDRSPAFRDLLGRGGRALTLTGTFLHRQILGPYANVIDRVEVPEASDLTGLAPRERELGPELYDPARVGELLPWLRNAGVARVLSLDPLSHADLVPLAAVPAGPPGVAIHVYGLDSWPRASLVCRATPVASLEDALAQPYRKGFDPRREVALERQGGEKPHDNPSAACGRGRVRLVSWTAAEERYEVESDAGGYLVVRASHARGWRGLVDGVPGPVLRANGKHRAVAVDAGRHEVVLRYEAPGLLAGVATTVLALAAVAALFVAFGRGTR